MTAHEPADERLGRLLSTHPAATDRYLRTGGTALACAVGGGLLAALQITDPSFAAARPLALVVMSTLAGLPIAAVQLIRLRRTGRDGCYELYENGLSHRTARRTRSWTWQQVTTLAADPEPVEGPVQIPLHRLLQRLGWTFHCEVRFTDGSTVRIDGYTADGPAIARALLTHRPDAVPPPDTGKGTWILVCTLLAATAGFAVAIVLMYRYLTSHSADAIGGSTLVTLALGMIACLVGFVLSLVVFLMMLIALLRTRTDDAP